MNLSISVFRNALVNTIDDASREHTSWLAQGREIRERCCCCCWGDTIYYCGPMVWALVVSRHWPDPLIDFFSKWWIKWSFSRVAMMRDLPTVASVWGPGACMLQSSSGEEAKHGPWNRVHAGLSTQHLLQAQSAGGRGRKWACLLEMPSQPQEMRQLWGRACAAWKV